MAVNWSYYNDERFERVNQQFLPDIGEGDTMATQATTAVNKLVYKWYNDGDVYDNRGWMTGWANDLSSYANWLYAFLDRQTRDILDDGARAHCDDEYEDALKALADHVLDEEFLEVLDRTGAQGSIYDCDGPFEYEEYDDEEEEW